MVMIQRLSHPGHDMNMPALLSSHPLYRWFGWVLALWIAGHAHAQTVAIPPKAAFTPVLAGPQHVVLLREGGLVIYMRHGATDARYPDLIPVRLDDCGSQRPLTDAGRQQLDQIGRYFARLDVPFDQVISSPFCRAVESAQRVFQRPVNVDVALRYTAAMPEAEKAPAVERTRHWLSLPVEPGKTNRVVVAHGPNIAELMDYLPGEGTMILFRPLGPGRGFEYLASITPSHWPTLLKALGLP